MKELVSDINSKLKSIIEGLVAEKEELENKLKNTQMKIDEKIDEAKGYKVSVDEAKEQISLVEEEITSYQNDLAELNERFGSKNLNSILDAGNKEINAKIVECQNVIGMHKETIGELTDKARTIKDLLINLKNDKEDKKTRLDNLTNAINYYETEINRIVNFSESNYDNLVYVPAESVNFNFNYKNSEPVMDSPIFDEIESIDKEDKVEEKVKEEVIVEENNHNNEETTYEPVYENDNALNDYNTNYFAEEKKYDNNYNVFDPIDLNEKEEPVEEKIDYEEIDRKSAALDDTITSLFLDEAEKREQTDRIDFKTLNDAIDTEYDNIFGNSEEVNNNFFDNTNFDINAGFEENKEEPVIEDNNDSDDIVNNFFMTNKLDLNNFSVADREYIRKIFNPIGFSKIIDILKKNNIDLNSLYDCVKVFEMNPNELDSIISKLLLSGQTTANIGYSFNVLPYIKVNDLGEVIDSYGDAVKNANIVDLLIKAKHLSEIGSGA